MTPTPISVLQGAAATPLSFTLAGTGDMVLQSVTARVDGTGAGSAFDAVLSLYSQNGRLLSRTKPLATIAAGAEAVVTWAPFLRKAAAGGALKALRLWTSNMALTIGNNNDGRLSYDNVSSFDSTVFSTVTVGGRVTSVHYKVKGWYADFVQFVFTTGFTVGSVGVHHLYTGDTLSGETQVYPADAAGLHVGPYFGASLTRYFPDEFDSLPGAPEIWVSQNSGAGRTINQSNWMTVYLGDSDF